MFKTTLVAKKFGIGPRSRKALAAWEIAELVDCDYRLKYISRGIAWAIQTGRLTSTAALALRGLSSYQQAKLLVEAANTDMSQGDLPRWLNARSEK